MEEIKPCPFCGSEAHTEEFEGHWGVICDNNFLHTIPHFYLMESEAIDEWNHRANPDRTDEFLKAIIVLKDLLEKANAISIPKTWVNDRPVITTGGTWPPVNNEPTTSGINAEPIRANTDGIHAVHLDNVHLS